MKSSDVLVFDEARRLLDMNLEADVSTILEILLKRREQSFPSYSAPRNGVSGTHSGPLRGEGGCSHSPPVVPPLLPSMWGRREHNVTFLQIQNPETHFVIIQCLRLVGQLWKDSGKPGRIVKMI